MDLRKGVEERFKVLRNAVKPENMRSQKLPYQSLQASHTPRLLKF
jgi:hypothetical protein